MISIMDTWEYTQNQIDLGLRTIERGNKIIQEAIEALNESAKIQVRPIKESPALGQRRRMHDE